MQEFLRLATLLAATVTAGLLAGLFYGYANSVMPALRSSTDDRAFVDVMQRINVKIQNGWFFLSFLGVLVFGAAAVVCQLVGGPGPALSAVAAGFALAVVSTVVTVRFNIPLNNQLDAAGEPGRIADLAGLRARFQDTWIRWNLVRTLASTAAFCCLCWALVLQGRASG